MCCFTRPVEHVRETCIFASAEDAARRLLEASAAQDSNSALKALQELKPRDGPH